MNHRPIFIVGMPACGKSTFGRALARELHRQYIDLDTYIESRRRISIREIFAQCGEDEFRRIETIMLREVGEFEDVVIATGGGSPCHDDNMEYMVGRGLTIWLDATLPRIVQRIQRNTHRRPMFAGLNAELILQKVRDLYSRRESVYRQAHRRVASDELEDKAQIAAALQKFIRAERQRKQV